MPSQRALSILKWARGPDVLDLGFIGELAGVGSPLWLHDSIRTRFPSAWGLDASQEAVDALRAEGRKNLFVGDAQDFSLDQSFDTIVAGELIEHLGNPAGLLRSARRHLKPGGRLIVTTPYAFGLHHWLYAQYKFPNTCANEGHVQWFCPATLTALARQNGFTVIHWQLFAGYGMAQRPIVRFIYAMWRAVGRLLPMRTRATTMLFVLEPTGAAP